MLKRHRSCRALVLVALALAWILVDGRGPVTAAEWGGIAPAETTMEAVRVRYGPPTRTTTEKVEGYDTAQWIYEGAQAPRGVVRLVVEFGLLQPTGFRPNLVRAFRLEVRPGAFSRAAVLTGWGLPTRSGKENDVDVFVYKEGLVVYFDKAGRQAELMLFTPPQPLAEAPAAPPR